MSKRSSTFTTDKRGKVIDTLPGMWSDFDFDFSRAPIFYPLNTITIEKGNFSSAKFYSKANFSETTFTQNADFSSVTFTQDARFMWATFTKESIFGRADFSSATFTQDADFSGATFIKNVTFNGTIFEKHEPTFTRESSRARFSVHSAQEDYVFSVSSGSKPIHTRETKLDDVTRRIPIGTVLFDPSSPKDENGKYRESPPA